MPPVLAEAESVSREIIVRLLDGSLQGALVVALVWVVCGACTSVPASVRAWLWWLACLKLVLALVAFPAVPIRVLPSTPHGAARTASERMVDTAAMALPVETIKKLPRAVLPPAATRVAQSMGWRTSALLLAMAIFALWWVTVLAVQGVVLLATHRRLSALVKRAHPADEHCLRETTWLSRMLGLRRVPDVLLSHDVTSPQVVGLWRPRVLLPAATSLFSDDEWRMMLCHELTHVRRRDLVLGWIPALAERSFFFHPLARLAAREYVLAREAACDAAVLRALSAEPHAYGRLLVRLGVSGHASALSAAGASHSASMLKRRLEMLHVTASLPAGTRRLWLAAVTLALAAVPFQLTARAAEFLPSPLAPSAEMSSGTDHRIPADAQPRLWVLHLFGVVQDHWVEGRRMLGGRVLEEMETALPAVSVRFGVRRPPSRGEEASAGHAAGAASREPDVRVVIPEPVAAAQAPSAQTTGQPAGPQEGLQGLVAASQQLLEQQEIVRQLQTESEADRRREEQLAATLIQHQAQIEEAARRLEWMTNFSLQNASDAELQRLRERLETLKEQIALRELASVRSEELRKDVVLEQVREQQAQLEAARAALDRQRALMEQAEIRLREAEQQLVEALTKMTRALRRSATPAPQPPAPQAPVSPPPVR